MRRAVQMIVVLGIVTGGFLACDGSGSSGNTFGVKAQALTDAGRDAGHPVDAGDAGAQCGPGVGQMGTTCPAGKICKVDGTCVPPNYTVDVDAGVVKDNNTNALWQRDVPDANFTWAAAKNYCHDLQLDGLPTGSWVLPGWLQLFSLVEEPPVVPSIDPAAFPNTPSAPFWSSTCDVDAGGSCSSAWYVYFNVGAVYYYWPTYSNDFHTRCVYNPPP